MSTAPAIGIDLGTTYSLAAVCRNGKTEVIPNKEGKRLTPSVVFYHPESLKVAVGTTAKDMEPQYRENVLFDQKRIIGRKYDDVYVQEKIKSNPDYTFKIVQGKDGNAEVELIHNGVKVCKSPEEACSEILKYLRECASTFLGTNVTEAVISIPARFSNAQRKATRTAAELAGLTVLKLITEPVAGAFYYNQDKRITKNTLLVLDFGGGTLDVSIIDVNRKLFIVKNVEGDTFLGGRDFDDIMMNYFKDEIFTKYGEQSLDRLLPRLRPICIKLKEKLSTEESHSITLECMGNNGYIEHKLEMSRTQFEDITKQLLMESIMVVDKCLKEAGLSVNNIMKVILVGGTTKIPKIQEMLRSHFKIDNLQTDLNPDEAVALGAAMEAALLKKNFRGLENYKITDVTPLSIGFGVEENLMQFVIKKNTPIPFKSKPIRTVTAGNNQLSILKRVFEGERKNCAYNNLLGSFIINNIPKGKAGDIKLETTFFLNEDGILEVEAFETTTGIKNKLVVTLEEYRVCANKKNNINNDAKKNVKDDNIFEKFTLYRSDVEKLCQHVLYYLNEKYDKTQRDIIHRQCKVFADCMKKLEYTEIDSLRKNYQQFRKKVRPIFQKYKINVDLILEKELYSSVIQKVRERKQEFKNLGQQGRPTI